MLQAVDQILRLVEQIAEGRELTSDEQREQAALVMRRVRLQNSLAEAGS